MDPNDYWILYDRVKNIMQLRGVYCEETIQRKVEDIINRKNVSHEAATSTNPND